MGSVSSLSVTAEHVLGVESLPRHHRDPSDRLVAQAQLEKLTLVASDPKVWAYDVVVLKT